MVRQADIDAPPPPTKRHTHQIQTRDGRAGCNTAARLRADGAQVSRLRTAQPIFPRSHIEVVELRARPFSSTRTATSLTSGRGSSPGKQ